MIGLASWSLRWRGALLELTATPAALPSNSLQEFCRTYCLTKREQEVTSLITEGKTNQEIAEALFISIKTVKDHNYKIFQKTRVSNRTELARMVYDSQSK